MIAHEAFATYHFRISDDAEDRAWDLFVERTPGGHHVQTSLWGQVKATTGWRATRVVVTDGSGDIVGGAQILARPLPLGRAVGYVPKGPVIAQDDPALIELLLRQVTQLAGEANVAHLTIQPPNAGPDVTEQLVAGGFMLVDTEVAPTASVHVDLTCDEDTMLSRMKKNHRRYIRHGLRQGVVGRRGSRDDLAIFHELLSATARRQGFTPYPLSYFATAWDVLSRDDHIALFLTEFEGEPVSAQIAIGFGDTVITKNSGWSGRHSSLGPNHVLEWTTMNWAKSAGYRVYDLEGIDAAAGRMIASGKRLPDEMRQRPFFWKLGFGGEVALFPPAYVHVANPLFRRLYFSLYPWAAQWPVTGKLIARLRSG